MRIRHLALVAILTLTAVLTGACPAQANPTLHFSKAYVNSPGSDTGSNTSLNAEYIVVKNSGTTAWTLTGYTIRDKAGHVYKFPTFKLNAGASVYVHTGSGTNTTSHLYWRSSWYIWNNTGDTAYLRNTVGTLKDSCTWGSVSSYVTC
jgi:Lamin Tail Domain